MLLAVALCACSCTSLVRLVSGEARGQYIGTATGSASFRGASGVSLNTTAEAQSGSVILRHQLWSSFSIFRPSRATNMGEKLQDVELSSGEPRSQIQAVAEQRHRISHHFFVIQRLKFRDTSSGDEYWDDRYAWIENPDEGDDVELAFDDDLP